jgi:hypothetical protein
MRWLNPLIVLLVNAVPLLGVLCFGWSVANVLALFWMENVLVAICTCIRIKVHRRLTDARGYSTENQLGLKVNNKPYTGGLLGEYANTAFVFTLVHGVFLGAIIFFLADKGTDPAATRLSVAQFVQGTAWIALTLVIGLAIDLAGIRTWSYERIKSYAQSRLGGVIVLHLTIILGMFALMAIHAPTTIVFVLIVIKTLWELANARKLAATTSVGTAPQQRP